MINNTKKDYEDFLKKENEVSPSHKTTEATLNSILDEMGPSNVTIFIKLIFIQLFTGLTTMLVCPQFNMSLTNNHELFHYFHRTFGNQVCMALCGGIFLGSGAIVAAYVLKEMEIKAIFKHRFLHFCALSGASVAVFSLIGTDIYLSMIPYWILGSIVTACVSFIINSKIKALVTA